MPNENIKNRGKQTGQNPEVTENMRWKMEGALGKRREVKKKKDKEIKIWKELHSLKCIHPWKGKEKYCLYTKYNILWNMICIAFGPHLQK